MAFKFFHFHGKKSRVKDHFQQFHEKFSEEEKTAVLCSMFIVANSDGEYHDKESEFFKQTAEALNYKVKYEMTETVKDFLPLVDNQLFRVLRDMSNEQKDWFIVTLHGMIMADGIMDDTEVKQKNLMLRRVGITQDHYDEVVQRSELLAALS